MARTIENPHARRTRGRQGSRVSQREREQLVSDRVTRGLAPSSRAAGARGPAPPAEACSFFLASARLRFIAIAAAALPGILDQRCVVKRRARGGSGELDAAERCWVGGVPRAQLRCLHTRIWQILDTTVSCAAPLHSTPPAARADAVPVTTTYTTIFLLTKSCGIIVEQYCSLPARAAGSLPIRI